MQKILITILSIIATWTYAQTTPPKIIITYNHCSKVTITKAQDAKEVVENFLFTWPSKNYSKKIKPYKENGKWKLNIQLSSPTNFSKLSFLHHVKVGEPQQIISKSELNSPNYLLLHADDFPYCEDSLFILLQEVKDIYVVLLEEGNQESYTLKKVNFLGI